MTDAMKPETFDAATDVAERLRQNVDTVVLGKDDAVTLVIAALACGGHVLLEDVPGTAKTVLARAIAGSIEGAAASRIQCTPDLQPTDITGLSIWNPQSRQFEFRAGPVFANVVVVDEINRALPKAQSALLEAMAERQVTVDGVTRRLPVPFLLIATENPIEQDGTFPLPEAQLDRFFLRTSLGYPDADDEVRILDDQRHGHPLSRLRSSVKLEELDVLAERGRVRLRRRAAQALDRRRRARDAHTRLRAGRRVGSRQPRPRARSPRVGAPPRPALRDAR